MYKIRHKALYSWQYIIIIILHIIATLSIVCLIMEVSFIYPSMAYINLIYLGTSSALIHNGNKMAMTITNDLMIVRLYIVIHTYFTSVMQITI